MFSIQLSQSGLRFRIYFLIYAPQEVNVRDLRLPHATSYWLTRVVEQPYRESPSKAGSDETVTISNVISPFGDLNTDVPLSPRLPQGVQTYRDMT